MAALNLSAFDAMMKEIYPDIRVESLATKDRPLLQYFMRDEFEGDAYIVPLLYEDPQSVGHTFATVQTNNANSKQVKFVITEDDIKQDYGVVKIDGKAIHAARSNVGSFIRAKDTQISGMLRQLGKHLHIELYRGGSASLGQLAASSSISVSTNSTLTLTRKSDVHNFGVGQTLIANNTDNSTSMKTGGVLVIGRDVAAGKITVSGDVTGLASAWADGDYLFTDGDQGAGLSGLEAWIPLTAPGATSFFSVDRTADLTRLSGHRVDKSSRTILENAQELAMLISEESGSPDTLFLNPRAGLQLCEQVGAKVERKEGGKAGVGFTGFTIVNFVTGPIDVVFDVACPQNRGFMLEKESWRLLHMLPVPHIITDDGQRSTRGATSDDIEVRGRWWCQLTCRAPGHNGVMSVAVS